MQADSRRTTWRWFLTVVAGWLLFGYALWNLYNIAVYDDVYVVRTIGHGATSDWHWITPERAPMHFIAIAAASVLVLALLGSALWSLTQRWIGPDHPGV
ncbi:hypothetical protein [Labrys wisconsinensis]|uniref:Uncharacterized protein n=1 Tax=Labrys wisconsinensis TaxID=425677 RepID=A0ABU0JFV7_9HYPH|nr:hypothetical protein [Labrys wisconsinensis]MDQ0473165.1 hypothetical protein [Labrys wisconsinensis]